MGKVKYSVIALAFAVVGFGSCTREEVVGTGGKSDAVEPVFSFSTRSDDPPNDDDTFVLMAYHLGASLSNQYIVTDGNQVGRYAYDDAKGALVPTNINTTTYAHTPGTAGNITKDGRYGLHLAAHTNVNTQAGIYRIAMIHPAVTIRGAGTLGQLATFDLEEDVWASSPDDADGDGNDDDPFEVKIITNQEVHAVPPGTKLYPLRAEIQAYFYSSKGNVYTVDKIYLLDAGHNGWYSAREGIVYPNYNYASKIVYGSDYQYPGLDSLANHLDIKAKISPFSGPNPPFLTGESPVQYKLDPQRVFPADYRGEEAGAPAQIKPMALSVKLEMGGGYNNVQIPIALNMARNKRYTFYIDVQSSFVNIYYSEGDWEPVDGGNDNIGEEVILYATISLTPVPGDWTPDGGENDNIGGNI